MTSSMVEVMVDTMVLVVWRYLTYLQCKMHVFVERYHLTDIGVCVRLQ